MDNQDTNKKNIGRGIVLAAIISLLLPPAVNAQSEAEAREAVRTCQQVSGLSARIACYDRAFPPTVDSLDADVLQAPRAERVDPVATPEPPVAAAPRSRPAEPEPPLAEGVQIIEIRSPDPRTTEFFAADGRIFVRTAITLPRWPDTPFDAEVQPGRFGSIFLKLPNNGPRVRVAVRN